MKKEIAKIWVDALRSGKYKQGRDTLRSLDDTFCCLGVLCDLAVGSGVIAKPVQMHTRYQYNGEAKVLPTVVKYWAGMGSHNGRIGSRYLLPEINDEGTPFPEIADIIEANVEAL